MRRNPVSRRLFAAALLALPVSGGIAADAPEPRAPAPTLKPAATPARTVDSAGFVRRWLLLEPAAVTGRLTEADVERALQSTPYPGDPAAIRTEGTSANSEGITRRWHALDSDLYNVNLYHFAWALSKPTSNVLFWVVTVIDSPQELHNVRLAIGSNAASAWWLNDERVISLYNDRQSVIDDGVSRRVTLRKGRNVIRAAIINGGGATDFCARFLDDQDRPLTNLTVRLQARR
jgi:hypothetical protein